MLTKEAFIETVNLHLEANRLGQAMHSIKCYMDSIEDKHTILNIDSPLASLEDRISTKLISVLGARYEVIYVEDLFKVKRTELLVDGRILHLKELLRLEVEIIHLIGYCKACNRYRKKEHLSNFSGFKLCNTESDSCDMIERGRLLRQNKLDNESKALANRERRLTNEK